jgi:hypothetical protein
VDDCRVISSAVHVRKSGCRWCALRKTKHRGIGRFAVNFLLNLIAYNLIRIPKLVVA